MKLFKVILATLVVFVLVPESHALATSESKAVCTGSWNVDFSPPGVGLVPQDLEFSTYGLSGSLSCTGTVDRSLITGPGRFGKNGGFEGSCLAGKGSGRISVQIPTTGGTKMVNFPFTMVTGPGLGFKFGDSLFGPLNFSFRPTRGNCVTSPVTQISVVGGFSLKT